MNQIVLDSYYLASLFTQRFKEISLLKLNELLFLTQAYSLCEFGDGQGLYPKSFQIDLLRSV